MKHEGTIRKLRLPFGEIRMEPRIDLDSRHVTGRLAKGVCQNTATGSDLQHMVARRDLGQRNDFANDVGVDKKILAESFDRGW